MKPWRQWNAPLGLAHVLTFGVSLIAVEFTWIGLAIPHLSSLLLKKHFAERYPFLYDVADTAIAFTLLPLMLVFVFTFCYFYQRRYDRKIARSKLSLHEYNL